MLKLVILFIIGFVSLVLVSGIIFAVRHAPLAEEQEDGSLRYLEES